MKVLIAYDGSEGADAALDDLPKAGLANDVEALVLSVAELWLPPPPPPSDVDESFPLYTPPGLKSAREHVEQVVEHMRGLNNKASDLGSVASSVLSNAPCSVEVVRRKQTKKKR